MSDENSEAHNETTFYTHRIHVYFHSSNPILALKQNHFFLIWFLFPERDDKQRLQTGKSQQTALISGPSQVY